MKLRGIKRIAAATAATALLVGGLASPARAEDGDGPKPAPGTSIYLNIPQDGVYAATAPNKGCAGIDTGVAVPGTDGWLFGKPDLRFKDIAYLFAYIEKDSGKFTILILTSDGLFAEVGTAPDMSKLGQVLSQKEAPLIKAAEADPSEDPDLPGAAPAGFSGKITEDGAWIKTPAGLLLKLGAAITDPAPEGENKIPFELVRACPAAPVPASPSAHPGAGPSLPVTGTNVWVLTGAGLALIAVGVVLFVAYRRRQNVKFVA